MIITIMMDNECCKTSAGENNIDQFIYGIERIALVVRHPEISTINIAKIGKVSLLDLLPPHLRLKVQQNASSS